MPLLRTIFGAILLMTAVLPAVAADDILGAMDGLARKAYQAGDMAAAKQSLDMASQLVGQKNAEAFAALAAGGVAGLEAERSRTASVGVAMFGASSASRRLHRVGTATTSSGAHHRRPGDGHAVRANLHESVDCRRHGQAHPRR